MNTDISIVMLRLQDRAASGNDDLLKFSRWELQVILSSLEEQQTILDCARSFEIAERIYVDWRDDGKWAVVSDGFVLDTAGEWVYEPRPSNRSDEFIERTRFKLSDAIARARALNGNHDGRQNKENTNG